MNGRQEQTDDEEMQKMRKYFERECQVLRGMRHYGHW